jgi:RimJ/RimL family protein N-acetyltransferase
MLDALTPQDIAEVMRIERLPGYDAYVGAWSAEEHAAEMGSPAARYLGWREGDGLAGFVIFQKFLDPVVRLRRIAVAQPGAGLGTDLLRGAVGWLFAATAAEAVDLHVRPENHRARTVYDREGFILSAPEQTESEVMILHRERWATRKDLT